MTLPFFLGDLSNTFLKNDILSIDIGFTNTKIVHVRKRNGKTLKVMNFAMEETPYGCIKNGIISDMGGIAENLKRTVEENRMSERNVKIVVSAGSNIISKVIFAKKVEQKILEAEIRHEIKKQMPFDICDQKLFYRITGEIENNKSVYYRVLLTVVPNETINNYVRLLRLLNFRPLSIEIPFSSVARFFSKGVKVADKDKWNFSKMFVELEQGSTVVVDLGSETTNLSILNNGTLEFNRIILAGGRNLDEIIGRKLKIKREAAEEYKKIYGISEVISENESPVNKIEKVTNECIRYYIREIFENIKRSIKFYVNNCGGQSVDRIVLIGGGAGLKGLTKFVEEITGLPVYTVDMMDFSNIEFASNLDKSKIRFLINTLGLAL